MGKKSIKISTRWIRETRNDFRAFLDETDFPDPKRMGERGPNFKYPEWLIMFIAILSVKLKIKTYVQVHKMAVKYWEVIAQGLDLMPISERQFRERLKKSVISLESQQRSFFSYFLSLSKDNVISADKMMNRAKGPVWHKKHKKIYRERSFKVEPMQGMVKDIFELSRCWMRGCENNRWLFAAMGLTIHIHQIEAFKLGKSTWNIKDRVLG